MTDHEAQTMRAAVQNLTETVERQQRTLDKLLHAVANGIDWQTDCEQVLGMQSKQIAELDKRTSTHH